MDAYTAVFKDSRKLSNQFSHYFRRFTAYILVCIFTMTIQFGKKYNRTLKSPEIGFFPIKVPLK